VPSRRVLFVVAIVLGLGVVESAEWQRPDTVVIQADNLEDPEPVHPAASSVVYQTIPFFLWEDAVAIRAKTHGSAFVGFASLASGCRGQRAGSHHSSRNQEPCLRPCCSSEFSTGSAEKAAPIKLHMMTCKTRIWLGRGMGPKQNQKKMSWCCIGLAQLAVGGSDLQREPNALASGAMAFQAGVSKPEASACGSLIRS
jgi:hypothetical protein